MAESRVRLSPLFLLLACLLLCTACGQKGDLYRPDRGASQWQSGQADGD